MKTPEIFFSEKVGIHVRDKAKTVNKHRNQLCSKKVGFYDFLAVPVFKFGAPGNPGFRQNRALHGVNIVKSAEISFQKQRVLGMA